MKLVESVPSLHRLKAEEVGNRHVLADGRNHSGKTLFWIQLRQVLDPIDNPRYLLYRESRSWFLKKRDYHAVPEEIGRRKEHAERFAQLWRKHIRPCRTGLYSHPRRKENTSDRASRALSSIFVKKSERVSAWR